MRLRPYLGKGLGTNDQSATWPQLMQMCLVCSLFAVIHSISGGEDRESQGGQNEALSL